MRAKMGKRVRAAYDAGASAYASQYQSELNNKPLDRELLQRFADRTKDSGVVWELGSGPGQVGEFVRGHGVNVHGSDISHNSLLQGRALYGPVPSVQADMCSLCAADNSLAGILAFYAICHLANTELDTMFAEIFRVLRPGGTVFLAFHIGDHSLHVDEFLGNPSDIDFQFFEVEDVLSSLTRVGFIDVESNERAPYPDVEHQSHRAYIFASKSI